MGNESILSCWAGPDPAPGPAQPCWHHSKDSRQTGTGKRILISVLQPAGRQAAGSLKITFQTVRPFGVKIPDVWSTWRGGKRTPGFVCALLIPGTLLLSWQSWENQFLSGKIIPAAALSSCRISGESEGTVRVFHRPCWLFQPCAPRGPCSSTNVPVHCLNSSLIPHLFGSGDSHTVFISGDPALRDAQEQRSSQ